MAQIKFKGKPIKTIGSLPSNQQQAPEFKLVRQDLSEVELSKMPKKKKVLNIVPSLDTSTCATTAKKFHQEAQSLDNVIIVNISMDLPFAQARFCKAEGLGDTETLSAFRSSFPKDYGVMIVEGPLQGLCSRAVIVLDENNKVVYSEQVDEITQEPNYGKVLEHLK